MRLQPFAAPLRLSPLRCYVEGLTGVFLKGVGLQVLWRPFARLVGLGAGFLAAAGLVFRRRMV